MVHQSKLELMGEPLMVKNRLAYLLRAELVSPPSKKSFSSGIKNVEHSSFVAPIWFFSLFGRAPRSISPFR